MTADAVDNLLNQWDLECPNLDSTGLGIVIRVQGLNKYFKDQASQALAAFDLELWEYDVLSALRRQGSPYEMKATSLAETTWLSPGAMTNRIDKLESRGWVERVTVKQDRRSVVVKLTATGKRITDKATQDRFELASNNVSNLNIEEQDKLYELLKKINIK